MFRRIDQWYYSLDSSSLSRFPCHPGHQFHFVKNTWLRPKLIPCDCSLESSVFLLRYRHCTTPPCDNRVVLGVVYVRHVAIWTPCDVRTVYRHESYPHHYQNHSPFPHSIPQDWWHEIKYAPNERLIWDSMLVVTLVWNYYPLQHRTM